MKTTEADVRRFLVERTVPEPNSGCLLWLGAVNDAGYGQLRVGMRLLYVHRLAFEIVNGPLAKGLHALHRCDVPSCVNAAHLFAGTHRDNMVDASKKRRLHAKTVACPHGHALAYLQNDPGGKGVARVCLTCRRERQRRYAARMRAQAKAVAA